MYNEEQGMVREGIPPPKPRGRGRQPGWGGCNITKLRSLKPGQDGWWFLSYKKMQSVKTSDRKVGIKITVRAIPDSDLYAIWVK